MQDQNENILEATSTKRNCRLGNSLEGSKNCSSEKRCVDCGTSKTPLWRGGPTGPKSLCNACGIRNRKKRRAMIGGVGIEDKTQRQNGRDRDSKIVDSLKQRVSDLRKGVMMKRSRRKLGEEEKAAVLLMALSYASVYA